ncbi:carboxypeptidase-like regulatory domain-containing protein [Cohnella silvisoli]|uniref:Carboxypeptidase-like regulatory domain-containing protein n=1 Tax=Cohnella silvisoli TaxID=2873699 RepID=A0ABV1KXE1_9BACL|nr:carboxypeptidase-like regulatory domain-containing protein [Cohnella silvisoli]MCD9024129.1 carboxypeptidase-like regulatory domain-containing protein [Cohnella silvisoli]
MRLRLYSKAAVLVLLASALAGCTGSKSDNEAQDFQLKIDQSAFSLKQWKSDGTHRSIVSGTFMHGDQPVVNAILHAGNSKRDIETRDDGSFQILLDQSLLGRTSVHVISLEKATINGKPISQDLTDKGKAVTSAFNVNYPIEIISTAISAQDPNQTEIKGRLRADQTASVAFFQEDKFKIAGLVKDADGKPVSGAVVWIDRDAGEGFAKSTPTDENGQYSMYYLPEEDEDTNLSVTIGTVKYTLPANKVFHFPEDTSLNVDITLPREGTVIDDKPPTLVSHTAPGALYLGLLVGLDVAENVNYSVTIPDAEGNFTITVPTSVWEKNPTFFETNMKKFIEKDKLQSGDSLPSSFIEVEQNAPHNIKAK